MIFLLRFVSIFFLLAFNVSLIFSCGLKNRRYLSDGLKFNFVRSEWINENVYKIQTYGQWDRTRYRMKKKAIKGINSAPEKISFDMKSPQKNVNKNVNNKAYSQDSVEDSRIERAFLELKKDANVAAKVKAMKNFKEEMISYLKKMSKEDDRSLISHVMDDSLKNVPITLEVVKEKYSKKHDVVILFHIKSEGLKSTVDAMVDAIVQKAKLKNETPK